MPRFFDRNNLTPEQKSRWDGAVAEYTRVMESNLDALVAAMTPGEQAKALTSFRENAPDDTRSLRDWMKLMQQCVGGSVGEEKSALFSRLLNGKTALPFPPPTAHSYPWYEVIEAPGPFPVMLGGTQTMGSHLNGTRGASGEFAIGINQCNWAVVSLNDAARSLFGLQDQLSATAVRESENSMHYQFAWTKELLAAVLNAYASAPEMIVRHGQRPEYRLYLGRNENPCQRGYALDSIADLRELKAENFSNCGNVLDTHHFFLNPEFGEVTCRTEHPRVRLEKAQERLKMLEANEQRNPIGGLDRLYISEQLATLEDDVIAYEADPTRGDMVILSTDGWVLGRR